MPLSDVGRQRAGNLLGYLAPGFGQAFVNKENSRTSEEGQVQAGEQAKQYMQEKLDYIRGQNAPLISMGDTQLDALRRGVESGQFDMNESMFNDYQQWVVPQYEQGGKFQYENRQNIVTPEKFQYSQANPEAFKYEQQAPAAYGQQQGTQQATYQQQPNRQQPQQYNEQYAASLTPEQRNQYNQQQFGTVQNGQFVQSQPQQSTFNQQQPAQVQYQNFQSNQQAPQFNSVQNFGQQPQQYQAGEAPTAQYVQPQQQFQSKQFSLQDDPVYQKRLADANKATEASAASRGMQLSGSNLKALQENASNLAAQEGDAAFNRFQQQDQTDYGRFQDQRTDLKDTTRYQSEDQYQRYLDSQNIRGAESDKAIAQWNADRQFNQGANVQNFQTAQDAYTQNRGQDADIYNMNAQNQLAFNAQNYGQFNTNRGFDRDTQAQNYDQYMQGRQQAQSENQQNYGQFADQRDFAANQYQQNIGNQLDYYNVNNQNYTNDRAFNYGVNQDYENQRRANYEFDTGVGLQQDAARYGQLVDSYTRQAENKKNKYGMIGDLANIGMTARQQNVDATTGYYGSLADIGMQQANARAAGAADRASRNTLLGQIGL